MFCILKQASKFASLLKSCSYPTHTPQFSSKTWNWDETLRKFWGQRKPIRRFHHQHAFAKTVIQICNCATNRGCKSSMGFSSKQVITTILLIQHSASTPRLDWPTFLEHQSSDFDSKQTNTRPINSVRKLTSSDSSSSDRLTHPTSWAPKLGFWQQPTS